MKHLILIIMLVLTTQVLHAEESSSTTEDKMPTDEIKRFSTVINYIKNYYVTSVNNKVLFDNAIKGMVENLDPHSDYLNEEDFKELDSSTKGEFSGLGLEITIDNNMLKVISPLDDAPAAKAGIQSGDRIIMIDDKPTRSISLKDAVELLRGEKNSKIRLTILRDGTNKPLIFDLTREVIHVKSVKSKLLDKQFAYIRISQFQSNTAPDLLAAMNALKKQTNGPLKGLVLDLRNNPGGLLDSAVEISDAFIDTKADEKNKLIVFTKGKIEGSDYKAYATPGDVMQGAPIVVLINEGSASGSEIVAGALQDQKRALLVGTTSFGKGSVQTVIPLDRTHAIKLTTALYFTPSGRSIQAKGIKPDLVIKNLTLENKKGSKDNEIIIKESGLKNHINNIQKSSPNKIIDNIEMDKTVYEDFQLYEAFNLLKGLAFTQSAIGSN